MPQETRKKEFIDLQKMIIHIMIIDKIKKPKQTKPQIEKRERHARWPLSVGGSAPHH